MLFNQSISFSSHVGATANFCRDLFGFFLSTTDRLDAFDAELLPGEDTREMVKGGRQIVGKVITLGFVDSADRFDFIDQQNRIHGGQRGRHVVRMDVDIARLDRRILFFGLPSFWTIEKSFEEGNNGRTEMERRRATSEGRANEGSEKRKRSEEGREEK